MKRDRKREFQRKVKVHAEYPSYEDAESSEAIYREFDPALADAFREWMQAKTRFGMLCRSKLEKSKVTR